MILEEIFIPVSVVRKSFQLQGLHLACADSPATTAWGAEISCYTAEKKQLKHWLLDNKPLFKPSEASRTRRSRPNQAEGLHTK